MDDIIEKNRSFVRDNLTVNKSLVNTSSGVQTKRLLQHLMTVKFQDKRQQSVYEILLTHALQAESLCPGAGRRFLEIFSSGNVNTFDKVSSVKNRSDVLESIKKIDLNKNLLDILDYVLTVSDENTVISIKKSSNAKTYIEEFEGHSFYVKRMLDARNENFENPRVACIDGYIENISELHHLLTDLSSRNEPCLIVCRGMSQDVLHTIKVNNDRGTINVIPLISPFDVDNVNVLVDIAVVSATDVVSSNKGELISTIRFDTLGKVENARIYNDKLVLKNKSTRDRVKTHINNLKKKIEERSDLEEILSKRLRSLSSSCIEINLPDDMNFFSDSQQLDEGIRVITSCIKNTYSPNRTASLLVDKFYQLINDSYVMCLL